MTIVKLSRKNQIVLPREARTAMGITGGARLLTVVKGRVTILLPKPRRYVDALAGRGTGVYGDSDRYLRKERASWPR